jgi:hypothetical protein
VVGGHAGDDAHDRARDDQREHEQGAGEGLARLVDDKQDEREVDGVLGDA